MLNPIRLKLFLVLGLVVGLAACESAEEKAEGYYQSGLALFEEGDLARASIEFRNVLQLNEQHRDARIGLAEIERADGNLRGAYSQYLRVAEQFADDLEPRIALAEIAIAAASWEEARRHGERAIELAPDNPAVEVIALNLEYVGAVQAQDTPARRAAAQTARVRSGTDPENLFLREILIDNAIRNNEFEGALAELDEAQAIAPDLRRFYDLRLGLLGQLGRADEVEVYLREMLAKFPDDEDLPGVMMQFYVTTNNTDSAQSFLRETAEAADDEETRRAAYTTLVQLITQLEGRDAAIAELDALIETQEDSTTYRTMRAFIRFDAGQQDQAISEVETLLAGETTPDETTRLKVGLAQMLIATSDIVGARAQVEEILEANSTQPDALKMKASWLIESDDTQGALSLLRLALDQDSEDVTALTLTAQAYDRSGDRNLTREFLALAADAPNAGADEILRYADMMIEEERYLPAEEALLEILRSGRGNQQILQRLGSIYLRTEDWGRAQQVEGALNELGDPAASQLASVLQAARLSTQGRTEEAVTLLEDYASNAGEGELGAQVAVIRARLASGDSDGALAFAEEFAAEAPDDLSRKFVLAAIQSVVGNLEAAETNYREIIEADPKNQQAWISLIQTQYRQGNTDGAETTLAAGLEALPDALQLLWAQASFSEQRGDIEGAIELYELIYERAPNDLVAANNLASLISTYRDDDENLDRAYAIARRLRGSDIAPFQDTYGWIAFRRDDLDEALDHLEPAAAGLPDDALVQFHLAMTYAALERDEDALPYFERALELAGPDDTRAQFETAREEIVRIQTPASE